MFDIQQGVAIGLFVKEEDRKKTTKVQHSELWGFRKAKYAQLAEKDVETIKKKKIAPTTPFYLLIPQDTKLLPEYKEGWKLTTIFPENSVGIVTSRDNLIIRFTEPELRKKIKGFLDESITDEEAKEKYLTQKDKLPVKNARQELRDSNWSKSICRCLYRPFDYRMLLYHDSVIERSRREIMFNMLVDRNIGLIATRQVTSLDYCHVNASRYPIEYKSGSHDRNTQFFPLYLYPTPKKTGQQGLHEEEIKTRKPNLAPEFVAELEAKLKLTFIPDGQGDLKKTFGPQDVFYYIYAVLHSPTYRSRYAEFLKIDFPRVPLTSSKPLFRKLITKGKKLVELHLMESDKLADTTASGVDLNAHLELKNEVVKVTYDDRHKRVYINKGQYFSGVEPAVWNFHVGGYQVCHKWLKDRKGRKLNYDDITHYQKIVLALRETIRLMGEIDEAIPEWPIG